jgi:hypothetical protein
MDSPSFSGARDQLARVDGHVALSPRKMSRIRGGRSARNRHISKCESSESGASRQEFARAAEAGAARGIAFHDTNKGRAKALSFMNPTSK